MGRVLIVALRIRLPLSHSLKDKRRVRQHIIAKLRQRYNLSAAETSSQDVHQTLDLTLAYVALNESSARQMEDTLRLAIEDDLLGEGEISDWQAEIY